LNFEKLDMRTHTTTAALRGTTFRKALRAGFLAFSLVLSASTAFSQAVGDYQTAGTVAGSWTTLSFWQRWNGSSWQTPTVDEGYPGEKATPSNVTIRNNRQVTLNVSPANPIGNLTFASSTANTYLTFSGTNSLTVNGSVTLSEPTSNNRSCYVNVANGSLTAGSVTMPNTARDTRDCYLQLDTGTVTVGNVTMEGSNLRNYILFSGGGTVNVQGTITGGGITSNAGGGAGAPTSGTVNYNSSSSQSIGAYTYYNLTSSGGGTKTLSGNVTVNNILNLSSGNISLGSSNYNLTLASGGSVTGSFDANHMIVCDGTGSFIKQGTAASNFVMVYPVGTGARYTPFEITSLTATVTGTGSVSVRAVAGTASGPPSANSTDLQKYWIVGTTNLTVSSADLEMTYIDPDEVGTGGDQSSYVPHVYSGGSWIMPSGGSGGGINPMTVMGSSILAGHWTAREAPITYYSYQSGDWGTALTWTTDPSGTLSVNPAVPGALDRVVILNGRTVNTSVARTVLSLQINEGGKLDIGSTTGHNFGDVRGKGLLRLSTATFPGGIFNDFVSPDGGTVEYYNLNNTNISTAQLEYNNLIISNYTATNNSVYLNNLTNPTNYTINGNFSIVANGSGSLTFFIGSSTASDNLINLTIYGNLSVNSNCNIRVSNFATGHAIPNPNGTPLPAYPIHSIYLYGDLINNGSIRFTGLTSPVVNNYYTLTTTSYGGVNYGAVQVYFRGSSNNVAQLNGTTDFYRLIVEKGVDQTYTLEINASNTSNFALYGPNNQGNNAFNGGPDGYGFGVYYKALFLHYGTLKLNNNINIPSLTEGGQDFNLIPTACLWVNGANVSTTVTGVNGTGYQAATLYGKLRISAGTFSTGDAAGLVLGTLGTPYIMVEGTGTLDASQVWAAVGGGNIITYYQTGGTVNIRLQGENHAGPMLGLNDPSNVFIMTGGTLNFTDVTFIGGGTCTQIMDLRSNSNNFNVGGDATVNFNLPSGYTYTVNTTVPFNNLNITRRTGAGTVTIQFLNTSSTNVTVMNNLLVSDNTVLDLATNNLNLTVGGNFTLNANATYSPGTNTTTFNGLAGQVFANNGTITSGLYNMTVTNRSNTNISQNLTIRNNLAIDESCFLQDMGRTINVGGSITNSGTHISQASGSITLTGNTAQTIGGNGNGAFGNLNINKTGGSVTMAANQRINGNLRLASNYILDIGTYKLTFSSTSNIYDALTGTGTAFSGTKMIRTAGNMSDGGVSKEFGSTSPFLFPLGTANDYTPATIQFSSAPSTWGTVNIKPVARYQNYVTSSNSLDYYWKVTSTGFSGLPANSISHTYRYVDSDIRGTEANYIPGVYRPYSWTYINDIAQVVDANNEIRFWNISNVDGDYTAGELSAFGTVKVFYSRQNGNWEDVNTWSSVSVGGPVDGALPGASNPVVIGDGNTLNHTVTITTNNKTTGGLEIRSGSVLDIGTTTGHNFGALPDSKILGTGKIRISSSVATATFPAGDFGNFLSSGGGTVEYYTTGTTNFTLPTTKTSYNNLIISPASAQTITFPNISLRIYDDLLISGTGTGVAQFNSAAAQTLTVDSNLIVNGGILRFMNNNNAQTVNVNGDVNIASGATFDVSISTNATNILNIYGNLNNNGTFDMYGSNTARVTNVYFKGNVNRVISGTGINEFNYLYVDKGSSRNTILNVTANNLTLQGTGTALILNNGTFRISNSSLNMTLSSTTAFTVPSTAALSAYDGTVNIGTTNNAGDLILNGRLEIINNGKVNIGQLGQTYNNDIEYASGGNPEIIVADNGYLFVNGQVRRSLTISSGSLNYSQSGNSTVIIDGQAVSNTRAMFEILNDGTFNMSGGTLTISRNFNNASYNELYINPATYSVTGGTVRLGSAAAASGSSFNFVSLAPLWNLIIDAKTTTKIANLRVSSLNILNNLTIEDNSEFHANGFDVTIGGNLANNNLNSASGISNGGYQPGSLTQTTTFNGASAQTLTGNGANLTNFGNLVVNKTDTLNLASNSNVRVNNNFSLISGTLNDGGNNITIIGDIYNSAVHTSPLSTGGIILNGSSKQEISGNGNGTFGNVQINNSVGINLVDNSTINGVLTFTVGNLYIDDYLLTLGQNASIGGTPNVNSMILLNGVISDQGVKKLYPSGAYDFTFPIGVSGKYTPARFNVTSNGAAGNIIIRPINYKHPALSGGGTSNRLDYYWFVTSGGFSNPVVEHTYYYDDVDIKGNENTYVAGRFIGNTWTPTYLSSDNTINAPLNTINILPSGGVGYIDGEYTAGDAPNFVNLPVYYSRNATLGGNWTDPNAWTLNSDGSGGPAPSYPQGNPVVILSGHTITMDANTQNAYSVTINGTLKIGTTLYHNLGHIKGGGTLQITSTTPSTDGVFVFPGGEFDDFMNNATSTIELTNNTATPAYLPLKPGNDYKPYQHVIFSGSGIKYVSADDLKVLGNLIIRGGTLDDTKFNKNITVLGNWIDSTTTASGGFVPGLGTVFFKGTAAQTMKVVNATTTEQYYNLSVNNSAELTISGNGQAAVGQYLYLTNGVITTNATNLLTLTNSSTSVVVGGSSSSFVNGPLRKNILSNSSFNFPVGDTSRYGNVYVSSTSTGGYYIAQYYNHNPGNDGMDPNSKINPVDAVSNTEYWRINGPTGATANVRIRWDSQSGIIPPDAGSRTKLRIVEWNGSAWENRGNVINDGGVNSGTIQTSAVVAINGDHYFTIGVESLPTATITSGNSSICDDGSSTNISIDLTGVAPWSIKYKVNGANETTVNNIAVSPYMLVVSNAIEPLASGGPGNYVFNISYVRDATGSTGVRDFTKTVTITLNESPNPVVTGNTTVAISEAGVAYQSGTGNISGHTYYWEVSSGASITSGQGTYRILVTWPSSSGTGWVKLTETVTTGGCSKFNQLSVQITDIPSPHVTGPTPVCNGITATYSTPHVGTHTYQWSLPDGGGSIIGSSILNSVDVQWNSTGIFRVKVIETGSESKEDYMEVTVNPLPLNTFTVSDPSICYGSTANIIVYATSPGLSFQLRNNTDNSNVGSPVSSGPGGDVTINVSPVSTTVYNILATNEYGCSQQLTDLSTVSVKERPTASIAVDGGFNPICDGDNTQMTITLSGGTSPYSFSITDGSHTDSITGATSLPYTYSPTTFPIWTGPGSNNTYTYSIPTVTSANGCTNSGSNSVDVTVYKVPETGPEYHIPNNMGF